MTSGPDIPTVNNLLAARMGDLVRELAGAEPTSRSRDQWRFRGKGSLSVEVAGAKRGSWHDKESDQGGDALGLVAHLRGGSMKEAYAWALSWLGGDIEVSATVARTPGPGAPPATSDDPRKAWSIGKAQATWRDAVEPAGTLVEAYLHSRGLVLPVAAPMRFHPRAWRNSQFGPSGPAMVCLMTEAETGEPCGAHVTYLRPDGTGKADGERQKVMLGAAGIIRLVPQEDVRNVLGLAEGVETSLAVMQRGRWSPVWATASAGAIARFPVLDGITSLTVFGDNDPVGKNGRRPGVEAARECAQRWANAGREARILFPPAGDWDDALPKPGTAE